MKILQFLCLLHTKTNCKYTIPEIGYSLVLRNLNCTDKNFGDFLPSDEKIVINMLAERIKLPEANGFVKSEASFEKNNKFNYSFIKKGINLLQQPRNL